MGVIQSECINDKRAAALKFSAWCKLGCVRRREMKQQPLVDDVVKEHQPQVQRTPL